MKKDRLIILCIILFSVIFYALTLRGAVGNPGPADFKGKLDVATRAFELSPERGRYVQVVSLAETGSYALTKTWAEVAYPDVGVYKENYYSFFAPGISYITLPLYLAGSALGLGQLAVFSGEVFVSILSLIFIYLISLKIFNLPRWAALFAALIFGFGSTAWSYSVTLYQHAFTTFFILSSFYAVWKYSKTKEKWSFLYPAYVWGAYALAIFIDYPNAVLFLPVIVYLGLTAFSLSKTEKSELNLSIRFGAVFTVVIFLFVTGLHFWHNAHYFGSWKSVAGGLQTYRHADETKLTPAPSPALVTATSTASSLSTTSKNIIESSTSTTVSPDKQDIVGFFSEKHMPRGFIVLLFSSERGLFFFMPVFLLSLLGIFFSTRKECGSLPYYIVPLSLIAVNLFLYSSWDDPWGGWAFGPRYLIPSMPWLAIFVSLFISRGMHQNAKKLSAFVLFLYSSAISLIGVLTTNAVPPRAEALLLQIKKFNYLVNIMVLESGKSSSFVYNTYLASHIKLVTFFLILYMVIISIAAVILFSKKILTGDTYEQH